MANLIGPMTWPIPSEFADKVETAIFASSRTPETEKTYHDLQAAVRCFDSIVKAVRAGYRFDDEHSTAYIERMESASELLRKEIHALKPLYVDSNKT
jgi:hypothetical protein